MSVDRAAVKAWLRIPVADTGDDDLVDAALTATVAWVAGLPVVANTPALALPVWPVPPPDPDTWPADVQLGTVMLAARTYRRRNSAGGVESFGDSVLFVARFDPDIERLLRLNTQARPGVG
jgi:hypothetical protein